MSSNIEIRRICAWCKQEFIAHKTTTTCCSHRCANLLYKQKKREASIKANNQVVEKVIKEKPIEKIRDKPILTITEAATYIGVTRPTLYGYLKRGELKATRLGYKFLLKKEDIDNLFNKPIEFKIPVRDKPSINDFYTTAEVKEKYGVKDSWIFHIAKEHNIPRTFHRGKTYWSKKHIDDYFAKKAAGEVRYDTDGHLFFCFKECHSQEEGRHHGVLLQKACGHCQRSHSSRRAQILHHCRSDGAIQSDTGSTLPLCEIP